MCLIALAWKAHPRYPLIVAANRDEFYERPTLPAHWWTDAPIFAGRDERGGGTWMGVSRAGRFAALTNVRDPSRQRGDARSRGLLVSEVLADPRPLSDAIASQATGDYNGFTLLAADWSPDPGSMQLLMAGTMLDAIQPVAPGVHGLSNAALDTPWPKVGLVSDTMRSLVVSAAGEPVLLDELGRALGDRRVADDAALPSTGVSLEWERALSAPFIAMPTYGTRATTMVLIDYAGRVTFVERDAQGMRETVNERFAIG